VGPRLLRPLLGLLLKVYFRKVRVVGVDRLPGEGPLLVVSNHVNSLLDPLLLFALLPRPPRFLAKAPLFRHPMVAPFLRAMRALPVHRRQDGAGTAANAATFEACEHALVDGECIALFPEGLSHNEPRLQPLKTGAARILGRASRRGAATALVPVGLLFTARSVFRSEVTAVAGPPVPWGDLEWGDGEDPDAVRTMTARIEEALEEVTIQADRWEEYRLVESLGGLARQASGLSAEPEDWAQAQRVLLARFREARLERPLEMAALLRVARRYAGLLQATGLTDAEVAADPPLGRVVGRVLLRLLVLAAGWPPAFFGWVFHAVPYTLTGLASRVLSKGEDTASTYKIYAGLFAFPSFYALQLGLVAAAAGPWTAAAAGLLAPPCGLWALRYYGERDAFVRDAWAFLALRARGRLAARLRLMRAETLAALEPLVELYK